MPRRKKPVIGRPPEMKNGQRVNLYLDVHTLKGAFKIGAGNVSLGIRLAVQKALA